MPECKQISFHVNIKIDGIPKYEKIWNEKQSSALDKLSVGIKKLFPEILN